MNRNVCSRFKYLTTAATQTIPLQVLHVSVCLPPSLRDKFGYLFLCIFTMSDIVMYIVHGSLSEKYILFMWGHGDKSTATGRDDKWKMANEAWLAIYEETYLTVGHSLPYHHHCAESFGQKRAQRETHD